MQPPAVAFGEKRALGSVDITPMRDEMLGVVLPAMFGTTRGVTTGLMAGIRDWMLRLGERMAPCACTAGTARQPTDKPVAINANAPRRVRISKFARSWTMAASGYAVPRQ